VGLRPAGKKSEGRNQKAGADEQGVARELQKEEKGGNKKNCFPKRVSLGGRLKGGYSWPLRVESATVVEHVG